MPPSETNHYENEHRYQSGMSQEEIGSNFSPVESVADEWKFVWTGEYTESPRLITPDGVWILFKTYAIDGNTLNLFKEGCLVGVVDLTTIPLPIYGSISKNCRTLREQEE